MLVVTAHIQIPEDNLHWSFVRSGGPGGQNVNKVASKAVLRWDVANSNCVPDDVKARFLQQHRTRITIEGELVLTSQRYRDQERNRQDCLEKLLELFRQSLTVPRKRRPTKPSQGSKKRRLATKKHRSAVKEGRRKVDE